MSRFQHKIIYDPVPFIGGSKIAVHRALAGNVSDIDLVVTSNTDFWKNLGYNTRTLHCPNFLSDGSHGLCFFIKNFIFAIQIIWINIFISRISIAVGISGPGTDYALYIAKFFIGNKIIQLVQGPTPLSKTVGKCFLKAERIFYLPSSYITIKNAIERAVGEEITEYELNNKGKYQEFINGIPASDWPKHCLYGSNTIFWAASLLKWKGLEIFTSALDKVEGKQYQAKICYIVPSDNSLPMDNVPTEKENIACYENPSSLDLIREKCEIFVSTSKQEPFGLSILESLAAGMCVVIPSDGAYWDLALQDGKNCRKYTPDDDKDLANILSELLKDENQLRMIGKKGAELALNYKAEDTYLNIKTMILNNVGL